MTSTMRFHLCFAVLVLAVGCKEGNVEVDSGDIVFDAGADSGVMPVDSGPTDAGLPPGVVMEAMETAAAVDELELTRDSIPIDMQVDAAFVELALAVAGLDMLIGEEGLQGIETLSLDPPTTRAFADLRQMRMLDDMLVQAGERLATLGFTALGASVLDVHAAVMELHLEMVTLYHARHEVSPEGMTTYIDDTAWTQEFMGTGGISSIPFVVEGMSTLGEAISVGFQCFGGTTEPLSGRVLDELTGEVLNVPGADPEGFVTNPDFVLEPGEERIVAVEVDTPQPLGAWYDHCTVTLTHPRHSHGQVSWDPLLAAALADFDMALQNFAAVRAMWMSRDLSHPEVYVRVARLMMDHVAAVRNPDGAPLEDVQRFLYQGYYLAELIRMLVQRTPGSPDLYAIRDELTLVGMAAQEVFALVRSSSMP